jgi:hypothetical protein
MGESSSALPRELVDEFDAKEALWLPEAIQRLAQLALDELHELVKGMTFDVKPPPLENGEFWSIGSIEFRHDLRPIHLGFLEPMLRIPITEPLSECVVAFLLEIPGDKDLLKREHHDHFGWHYHYLDRKERRSNTILCWDTRAKPCGAHLQLPIFCETHAEGTKDFTAKPEQWGSPKRESMHKACSSDLTKWPLNEFKTPGRKAAPVWPLNAVLTAVSVGTLAAVPRFPSKKHPNKMRR